MDEYRSFYPANHLCESTVFTQDLADDKAYFGGIERDNHLFELGASVSGFYKFEALENVFIENRLAIYTDYLGEPENIDLTTP